MGGVNGDQHTVAQRNEYVLKAPAEDIKCEWEV